MPKDIPAFIRRESLIEAWDCPQDILSKAEGAQNRVVAALRRRLRKAKADPLRLRAAATRLCQDSQNYKTYDALDAFGARLMSQGDFSPSTPLEQNEIAYQPSPLRALLKLVELAQLRPVDHVVDLGSGRGLACMAISLFSGARTTGLEIDPQLTRHALSSAISLGLGTQCHFQSGSLLTLEIPSADLYYLYSPLRGEALRTLFGRLESRRSQGAFRVATLGPCTESAKEETWLALEKQDGDLAIFGSTPGS